MNRAFASYCVVGGLLLSLAGCNTSGVVRRQDDDRQVAL